MDERYYNQPDSDNSRPCEYDECRDGFIMQWDNETESYEKLKCPYCEDGWIIND